MKKGLNLFKSEISTWKDNSINYLPPKYLEFEKYFKLGEDELNIDYYIHKDSNFKIPITNVVYDQGNHELFIEKIFNPQQINSILLAGEKLEDTFTKFNLVRLGILTYPTNAQLYLGINDKSDKIFYKKEGTDYMEVESSIFEFAVKFKLVENSHQIKKGNSVIFIKKWGDLEWTKNNHEL